MRQGRCKSLLCVLLATLCVACGNRVASPLGWWDEFNPEVVMEDVTEAERDFMEWAKALIVADTTTQRIATEEFVAALAKDEVCFYIYTEWACNYLYGLGSPVRNEYAFGQILRQIVADERFATTDRNFIPPLLDVLDHNRVGEGVEELNMLDPQGGLRSLADFDSQRLLLLIVDTTCPSCIDMMQSVEQSDAIMRAVQHQELSLVVVAMGQSPESIAEFATSNTERGWLTFCTGRGDLKRAHFDLNSSPVLYLIGEGGVVEVGMTRDLNEIEEKL